MSTAILDHAGIEVSDVDRSVAFYREALGTLGITAMMDFTVAGNRHVGLGRGKPDFWISSGRPLRGETHVAFKAESRAEVEAFYTVAVSMGGRDNGPPGVRAHYHPDYYGALSSIPMATTSRPCATNRECTVSGAGPHRRPPMAPRFRVGTARRGDRHCRMCCGFGSFFGPLVTATDLVWTRGEPKYFRSSNRARRGFCAECGTPLCYLEDDSAIELAIGTLDDPTVAPPTKQINLASKVAFFDTLPSLTPQPHPEKEATFNATVVNYQHPDHETHRWPAPEAT